MELYITLGIIVIGIFLFTREVFSIDTTSILIMALFIVSGVLNPEEGFSGFNHPATLTLGCMFVVSASVFKSGIIDGLSSRIIKIAKVNYFIALVIFCLISTVFSAFINDAAVVAILIPLVLSVCRETGIAPSRLLIPVSFSALFGGTCTLIGTSTNILVSSIAAKSGLQGFNMFEFSLPALCLVGIGMAYIFVVAPILLPNRKIKDDELVIEAEKYTSEISLLPGNKDIGHPIAKSRLVENHSAQILSLIRNGERLPSVNGSTILYESDRLKVALSPHQLNELKKNEEYHIKGNKEPIIKADDDKMIYETMVPVGSSLAGLSLKKAYFRNIYNASVLAIRHRDEVIQEHLSDVTIKEGDMLLIYTKRENLNVILKLKILILLSEYQKTTFKWKKAVPAFLIAIGVVTVAALNITTILISSMVGALLLILTSVLKPQEAYEAIEWKVIFMMAGVLSMGTALEKTGGAKIISDFIFQSTQGIDPRITLSAIFLVTFLSTNVLSSKATAALMAPIVISLSSAMQVSEKPLLIAVMFACSLTFMTPISYPTNTMVFAPGNYKFNDYLKIGTPLNIIIWISASFIIPLFFPF